MASYYGAGALPYYRVRDILPAAGSDRIDAPSLAVAAMSKLWDPAVYLRGGTLAMRAAGATYLPQENGEDDDLYLKRINRSILVPFYDSTISHLANKPFQRDTVQDSSAPQNIRDWSLDIDREGTTLTRFLREAFDHALDRGFVYAMTDVPDDSNPRRTMRDEQRSNFRPYALIIPPSNVLAAVEGKIPGTAISTLVHFRYLETTIERKGDYGEEVVQRIRVYNRRLPDMTARSQIGRTGQTTWQLYESRGLAGQWTLLRSGTLSLNRIPVHRFQLSPQKSSFIQPPFLELSMMNISHWQMYSDFRNLLHKISMPVLWGAGWREEDIKDEAGKPKLIFGPNKVWLAADPTAKLGFVEHDGSALGMVRQSLQDLEAAMEDQAKRPFIEPIPRRTATEVTALEGNQSAEILTWISTCEQFANDILDEMALWVNAEPGSNVSIFNDFGALFRSMEDLRLAREKGDLTQETYWAEMVRRGILAEEFDPASEKRRLATEEQAKMRQEQERLSLVRQTQPDPNPGGNGRDVNPDPNM